MRGFLCLFALLALFVATTGCPCPDADGAQRQSDVCQSVCPFKYAVGNLVEIKGGSRLWVTKTVDVGGKPSYDVAMMKGGKRILTLDEGCIAKKIQ